MNTTFNNRRQLLKKELSGRHLDALLVTQPANWYYLTGFTGESGALLCGRKAATLVTDGRFAIQAGQETAGIEVLLQKGGLFEAIGEFVKKQGERRIGYDPTQLTVAQFTALKKASGTKYEWVSSPGLVESQRHRKEAAELAQMRKAAILAGDVVELVLPLLKPGVREIEIAAEIDYQMRRRGASGPAFESIVAFGERGALPHARPTSKRLRKNELVVLDLGVILGHYCSDITRTVFVGKASARVQGWYKAVLEAQTAAIAAVHDGAACGDVDAAARQVLAGYHLDRYFVHSTGHGLGLEVHEDPRVARGQKQRLVPGNVITIEPGVYVEGVGGIRIEDDVAVHADRTEILTRIPRDLIEL
jgi:Xaa-Pro aminopeptidase